MVVAVRIVLGALVAVLAIVASLPAVVLVDLASGGTGLGLCSSGLGSCSAGSYAAVEIAVVLGAAALILVFAITGCVRFLMRRGA